MMQRIKLPYSHSVLANQTTVAAVKAQKAGAQQLLLATGKLVTIDAGNQPAYRRECNRRAAIKLEALVGYCNWPQLGLRAYRGQQML